ncbi:egalitarian protein homolog [Gigantopelta aegis]|uniref:egalitarian protein homolog n=1 Tax=Gigantopelta aegis TaxID=1735272 RepID=UPI001B888FAB|nr:egalitarian protein homolog [Gigantopelta aegis]
MNHHLVPMAGVPKTYKVIWTQAEAKAEVKRLRASAVVSFDCETVDFGEQPQISLVQACVDTGPVCLFDVLTDTSVIPESGILELLEDGGITKIMHDCRLECSMFFNLFGVEIKNIFDTQVAYRALDAKAHMQTMSRAKMASFTDVCLLVGVPIDLSLKLNIKSAMEVDPCFWAKRPLTEEMKTYAAMDVVPLVSVYPKLKTRLSGSGYEGFFRNMCDEYRSMSVNPKRAKELRTQREKSELLHILDFNPNYLLSKTQKKILRR